MKIKTQIFTAILFLSCYVNANCQNLDTTRTNVKTEVDLKLNKFRGQQVTGIWMQIVGASLIVLGSTMGTNEDDKNIEKTNGSALMYVGGGCMFAGGIIRLSSFSNLKIKKR